MDLSVASGSIAGIVYIGRSTLITIAGGKMNNDTIFYIMIVLFGVVFLSAALEWIIKKLDL